MIAVIVVAVLIVALAVVVIYVFGALAIQQIRAQFEADLQARREQDESTGDI